MGLAFAGAGALMAGLATFGCRKTYRSVEKDECGNMRTPTRVPRRHPIPVLVGLLALRLIVIR